MNFIGKIEVLFEKYCREDNNNLINNFPNSREILFKYKAIEIVDIYFRARNFLEFNEIFDINQKVKDKNTKETIAYYKEVYSNNSLDAALIYYNILIDLTWTIFKLCTDNKIDTYTNISTKNCSVNELKGFTEYCEKSTENPISEDMKQYLSYINKLSEKTKYNYIINKTINDINKTYYYVAEQTSIRKMYNAIKHRKQIHYSSTTLKSPIKFKLNGVSVAYSAYELFEECNPDELKIMLNEFDNTILFPYIENLLYNLWYITLNNY